LIAIALAETFAIALKFVAVKSAAARPGTSATWSPAKSQWNCTDSLPFAAHEVRDFIL